MPRDTSTYTLSIRPWAPTPAEDASLTGASDFRPADGGHPSGSDAVLHLRLQRGDGAVFGDDSAMVIPAACFDRCAERARTPDLHYSLDSDGRTIRPPRPSFDNHASIDDVGAWLFGQLPTVIQDELKRRLEHTIHLWVDAAGPAAQLPWHRLNAYHKSRTHEPLATQRWHVGMQIGGDLTEDVHVQPSVLLLVGSLQMDPQAPSARYQVEGVIQAIRDAGFSCRVAAGRPAIEASEQADGSWRELKSIDDALQEVESGRYAVVHFFGHSNAVRSKSQALSGATGLQFEFAANATSAAPGTPQTPKKSPGPSEPPQPTELGLYRLRQALRRGRVSLMVLHACLGREFVAHTVLGPAPPSGADTEALPRSRDEDRDVDAVLTMGAFVPPAVCATFAKGLYAHWQNGHALSDAVVQATAAVREHHPGFDWLPQHWARGPGQLLRAGPREQRLAKYGDTLRSRLLTFDGLVFAEELLANAFDSIALHVALEQRDAPRHALPPTHPDSPSTTGDIAPTTLGELLARGLWCTLGGPVGIGKTTQLQRHTRRLAADRAFRRVPVYLALPTWLPQVANAVAAGDGPAVWFFHHVTRGIDPPTATDGEPTQRNTLANDLTTLASNGQLAVFFDGFDELSPTLRDLFVDDMLPLLHQELASCTVVIATRRYPAARQLRPEHFGDRHYDVEPIRPQDAVALLFRVCSNRPDQAAAAPEHRDWFAERVRAGDRLWTEIAQTPLFVVLLALQVRKDRPAATTRLDFFTKALAVLCSGQHRRADGPEGAHSSQALPHPAQALALLRYLAWRLTLTQNRTAPLATMAGWLAGRDTDSGLRPSELLMASLGDVDKWPSRQPHPAGSNLPAEAGEDRVLAAAFAFLRRVAEDTDLLRAADVVGATDAGEAPAQPLPPGLLPADGLCQFWHRSFQEALTALYLREQFLTEAQLLLSSRRRRLWAWLQRRVGRGGPPQPETAVRQMLASLEPWLDVDRLDPGLVRWHRAEIQREAQDQARLPEIASEGYNAPTRDPIARNQRLTPLRGKELLEALFQLAASARAQRDMLDALGETLSLIGDAPFAAGVVPPAAQQQASAALLHGLLPHHWRMAHRIASTCQRIPPAALPGLLAAMPELAQRAALIEHAANAATADGAHSLLQAFSVRGQALRAGLHTGTPLPPPGVDATTLQVRAWNAPGEVEVLIAACAGLSERYQPCHTSAQKTQRELLALPPEPNSADLTSQLLWVPGRDAAGHKLGEEPGKPRRPGMSLWRHVPAGTFRMGTPGGGPRGDEVLHEHTIDEPFWIAAVPVTVGLYRLFSPQHWVWVGNGYKRVDDPSLDPDTAVGGVSHHAASLFCRWLQRHAGPFLAEHLGVKGEAAKRLRVRLPTEAEWEYAARAGSETAYCFGKEASQLGHWGWHGEDQQQGAPHPVAVLEGQDGVIADAPAPGANRWGLFDVHGNVWEWCSDWYGPTAVKPAASGRFRVLRGGSYGFGADGCRSAYRVGYEPDSVGDDLGFRLVVSVPQLGR